MRKILSLDLGTASIGWAVRLQNDTPSKHDIVAGGVVIFPEGFDTLKGVQTSRAAMRRKSRSVRRQYHRRRMRKNAVLGILIRHGMVPLSVEELHGWTRPGKDALTGKRKPAVYPLSETFHKWLRLIPANNPLNSTCFANIYEVRRDALHGKLKEYAGTGWDEKMMLGRILYNYAQRRGFESSSKRARKETEEEKNNKKGADEFLKKLDGKYLAEYFSALNPFYDPRIRTQALLRKSYTEEFDAICEQYATLLPPELKAELFAKLFKARPLKSQKGQVGHCTLEAKKSRAYLSHPDYEWFRLIQFLQNVRIEGANGQKMPLPHDVMLRVASKIIREGTNKGVSKTELLEMLKTETKDDVRLAKGKNDEIRFPIPAPRTSQVLYQALGPEWRTRQVDRPLKYNGKKSRIGYEQLWHFLTEAEENDTKFKSDRPVHEYVLNLGLGEETAEDLEAFEPVKGYASLSLNAIRRITPWMEKGYPYHHAVMVAGMERVLGESLWSRFGDGLIRDLMELDENLQLSIAETKTFNYFAAEIKEFGALPNDKEIEAKLKSFVGSTRWKELKKENPDAIAHLTDVAKNRISEAAIDPAKIAFRPSPSLRDGLKNLVRAVLSENTGLTADQIETKLENLYHHSDIDKWLPPKDLTVPGAKPGETRVVKQLQTPYTGAIQNPAAMRTLHELKKLLNYLLREGIIETETSVVVEMGRELNDMNQRRAIQQWQTQQETEKQHIRKFLVEQMKEQNPSEDLQQRTRLWLEQIQDANGDIERAFLDKQLLGSELKGKSSEDLVKKMRLLHEQKGICLYSGKPISPRDVLASNVVELEHTIPRSKSNDSRMENLTLARLEANRLKNNRIPQEITQAQGILNDISEIALRLKPWKERIETLDKLIDSKKSRIKAAKNSGDIEGYNKHIVDRWLLRFERSYWRDKVRRFEIEEVDEGFARRMLVDTQVITKYALGWLRTTFSHVRGTKPELTALLRKQWGLQQEHEKKDRTEHTHHLMDALVIGFADAGLNQKLSHYWRNVEREDRNAKLDAPWAGFANDIKGYAEKTLVYHVFRDRFNVNTKRWLKKDKNGKDIYTTGKGVKASLHKETVLARVRMQKPGDEEGKLQWVRNAEGEIDTVYATKEAIENSTNAVFPRLNEYAKARAAELGKDGQKRILPAYSLKLQGGGRKRIKEMEANDLPLLKKNEVNAFFLKEVEQRGWGDVKQKGFYLPVKTVREKVRSTNPLKVRGTEKVFSHPGRPYKHFMYFENDGNHALAIYRNTEGKKEERKFSILSNLEAAKGNAVAVPATLEHKGKIFTLEGNGLGPQIFKIGKRVLLFEKSPDEVWEDDSIISISRRNYLITGLSSMTVKQGKHEYPFGSITLLHHSATGKVKKEGGKVDDAPTYKGIFELEAEPKPKRFFYHTQINALIEGTDFEITYDGKFIKL